MSGRAAVGRRRSARTPAPVRALSVPARRSGPRERLARTARARTGSAAARVPSAAPRRRAPGRRGPAPPGCLPVNATPGRRSPVPEPRRACSREVQPCARTTRAACAANRSSDGSRKLAARCGRGERSARSSSARASARYSACRHARSGSWPPRKSRRQSDPTWRASPLSPCTTTNVSVRRRRSRQCSHHGVSERLAVQALAELGDRAHCGLPVAMLDDRRQRPPREHRRAAMTAPRTRDRPGRARPCPVGRSAPSPACSRADRATRFAAAAARAPRPGPGTLGRRAPLGPRPPSRQALHGAARRPLPGARGPGGRAVQACWACHSSRALGRVSRASRKSLLPCGSCPSMTTSHRRGHAASLHERALLSAAQRDDVALRKSCCAATSR